MDSNSNWSFKPPSVVVQIHRFTNLFCHCSSNPTWRLKKDILRLWFYWCPASCPLGLDRYWMACPMLSGFQKWYETWKGKRLLILRSEGSWLAFSPLKKELEGQSTTFPAQNTFSAFAAALVIRKSETHPFRRTRFFWHDESKVMLGNLEGWRVTTCLLKKTLKNWFFHISIVLWGEPSKKFRF